MRLRICLPFVAVCLAIPAQADAQVTAAQREEVQAAYVAGDFDEAQRRLKELLSKFPEDADLLRRHAAVQAAQGDVDTARATIERAAKLAPYDSDIQLARANILYWQGRFGEAQVQADKLKAEHPNYPGLDRLVRSIGRAKQDRRFRMRSVGVGASVSDAEFASGLEQTWYVQRGSISAQWGAGNSASIDVEREERLATDTRISGRIDMPDGPHRYFVSASVTPKPDFRENWSLGAGGEFSLSDQSALLADGRFAEYRSDDVVAVGIGLRQRLSQDLEVTARSIHLLGGGEDYRLGGALRVDYRNPQFPELFAIVASYPDAEVDGTRQLRAIAAGVRFGISEQLSLGATGESESREDSYERTVFSLDLRWRFGE